MQQLNRLIEFRQAVYQHGFTKTRDAQFELLDSLLLSPPVRSYAELSCSPAFRRQWPSLYTAIEDGELDQVWLEEQFCQLIPPTGPAIFPLDGTSWPHPQARTLRDRQYVHQASDRVDGGEIGVGHPYSILAWGAEKGTSWAMPVSVRRVPSDKTEVAVGVEQVRWLCRWWQKHRDGFPVIVADGRYGNHHFIGGLAEEPCALLIRLRQDRVLYSDPGPYPGHGRPAKRGARFAFKEPDTWPEAAASEELDDSEWGKVRLRRWDNLHARQDARCRFSVLLVETHREREKPASPLWLTYRPRPGQDPGEHKLAELWKWYPYRWPIEPSIRFRKQELLWTLPMFQKPERCDRWTMLVTIAQWQLYLARDLVGDHPLPWQPAQKNLTPERVRQGLQWLFAQIGTPASPPQMRGKALGWPKGRPRTRPERHRVVKKQRK